MTGDVVVQTAQPQRVGQRVTDGCCNRGSDPNANEWPRNERRPVLLSEHVHVDRTTLVTFGAPGATSCHEMKQKPAIGAHTCRAFVAIDGSRWEGGRR